MPLCWVELFWLQWLELLLPEEIMERVSHPQLQLQQHQLLTLSIRMSPRQEHGLPLGRKNTTRRDDILLKMI
jgi:hypothetical protein